MLTTARSWLAHQQVRVPALCHVCGLWFSSTATNRAWCSSCQYVFTKSPQRCVQCAIDAPHAMAGPDAPPHVFRCGACASDPPPWQAAHAAVHYAFPWASLIAQFKYQRHSALARPLASLLAQAKDCQAALLQADVWLGVPITPRKLGLRGFNQTHLLLNQLARWWPSCPGAQCWPLSERFAVRSHQNHSQLGLGRSQRLHNLNGAFAIQPSGMAALHSKHVVIVDDVYTTGATLTALASVVQQAQPASLHVCVLARTPVNDAHNDR